MKIEFFMEKYFYQFYDWKKNQPFFWSDLLRQRQLFHTTYKMYMVSLGLWTFSLFLYSIAYGKYANTGYKETGTEYAGTWIESSLTSKNFLKIYRNS